MVFYWPTKTIRKQIVISHKKEEEEEDADWISGFKVILIFFNQRQKNMSTFPIFLVYFIFWKIWGSQILCPQNNLKY